MITATTQAPSRAEQAASRRPLFQRPIAVCVLTGETGSGKSVFPILATDAALNFDAPPECIVFDHEGSVEPYVGAMNFEWCDTNSLLAQGVHMKTRKPDQNDPNWKRILLTDTKGVNDSPAASTFRATVMAMLATEPGKYRVSSFDTFTPFQAGAMAWLDNHPEAFGRSANEYRKMRAATMIPDAREMLKYLITVDCRARFEMTVLNFHQKDEWERRGDNARRTGERISEAWELIDKVATLYATLDRRPPKKGKSAPRVPSAMLVWPYGKSRLMAVKDGEVVPALPPRMPEFTPAAIRYYLDNPPDYDNLKVGERMPDDDMTYDDRLRLQALMEADRRAAAEAQLAEAEVRSAAMATTSHIERMHAEATQQEPQNSGLATDEQQRTIRNLIKEAWTDAEKRKAEAPAVCQRHNLTAPTPAALEALSSDDAENLIIELELIKSRTLKANADSKLNASGTGGLARQPQDVSKDTIGRANAQQLQMIQANLAKITDPADRAKVGAAYKAYGVKSKPELSFEQAGEFLSLLASITTPPDEPEVADDDIPFEQGGAVNGVTAPHELKIADTEDDGSTGSTDSNDETAPTEMVNRLKSLIRETGGWPREEEWKHSHGYGSFYSARRGEIESLINKFSRVKQSAAGGVPGN